MQEQFFKIINDFNQSSLASAKRLGEFNQRTVTELFNKQSEVVKACYANSEKNAILLTQAKDPQSFMVMQSEMVRECGETIVNNIHEGTAIMDKAREELVGMFEESADFATDSFKKVTDLAVKA